jgi:hypothetical protein
VIQWAFNGKHPQKQEKQEKRWFYIVQGEGFWPELKAFTDKKKADDYAWRNRGTVIPAIGKLPKK